MTILDRIARGLAVAGLFAALPCMAMSASPQQGEGEGDTLRAEFDTVALDGDSMDELRAGFSLSSGLNLSFGIEQAVYVDGQLASLQRINLPNVAALVGAANPLASGGAGATVMLPGGTGSTLTVIAPTPAVAQSVSQAIGSALQGGGPITAAVSGGTTIILSSPAAQLIQNSADYRLIQASTTLDVSSSSLSMLRNLNLVNQLNQARNLPFR